MKIIAGDKEFIDTAALDVKEMVGYLKSYKGKSGSSCANAQEWLDAFEGADAAFGVTISKGLSGSFYAEAGGLMIGFEGGYNTNNNNNEH